MNYSFRPTPPPLVWGYPPGVSIVDMVPEDMLDMIHPHWKKFPPVNPMWHYLLGLIYIFLGITSICGTLSFVEECFKCYYFKTVKLENVYATSQETRW